jgi:diguanylate cyclase (GGDEF)-like protein
MTQHPVNSAPIDILVVDDTPENVRLLSTMLTKNGYHVRKAISGQMAITAVKTLPPDLILLDIMMPGMDGYEVCQTLKTNLQTADLPIIFLSALDDAFDKVKAFAAGGVDYITKPFHFEEVLARVRHQLALKTARNQVRHLNIELEQRVAERTRQLEYANAQLRQLAMTDMLTGLANRVAFMEQLEKTLLRTEIDSGEQFAVMFLDCDRFKIVNDSLGHLVGDELLIAIAHRLRQHLTSKDLLARLGGDEFAILLTDIAHVQSTVQLAKQLLNAFLQPFDLREQTVFINISIGIALSNPSYNKPEHLLRDADTAMYHAKAAGRAQYRMFESVMHDAALLQLQLETDLRWAISANQELLLHYQPIVSLDSGKIVALEALARWNHPIHGFIPPTKFVPVAEETGLIHNLGRWVLRQACDQLRAWQQQKLVAPSFSMSVNLSPYQVAQVDLVEQVCDILGDTQLNPSCLKLEITESAIIDNPVLAAGIFTELRQKQIQLSMDDFGTGYSSLSYLHSFPIDNLKIDRSFIQCLDGTPKSLGLVPVIMMIAQTMKMNVIAEGIETREQLAQLRSLGCHFGQGFLFAKPLTADQTIELLISNQQW